MYKKISLPFDQIPHLSVRDKAYQNGDPKLRDFYCYDTAIESFKEVIENRRFNPETRAVLRDQLIEDYKGIRISDTLMKRIQALAEENSYCIVTAHQPSLLTGPLYFIYKICSAISLAQKLQRTYPSSQFIPTFILGGEDHDFEEISTIHLFNKDFSWQCDQVGSVGRMNVESLSQVLEEVKSVFGNMPFAQDLADHIDACYNEAGNYSEFMFRFVHGLFVEHDLVIVNMDKPAYKEILLPYIQQDIEEEISHKAVNKDQQALNLNGFAPQAHARDVNIFYHDGDRHRVVKTATGDYEIGENSYSKEGLQTLLSENPASISPNVVLRPLFQELILPNLAYIGGGGEVAYWLERKSLFEAFSIPFPMLIRRDSVLLVDKRSCDLLGQLDLEVEDMFEREEQILRKFTLEHTEHEVDLSAFKHSLNRVFEDIGKKTQEVDQTLVKTVKSEEAKMVNWVNSLENRLIKAEKRKQETSLNKIVKMKQRLFPNNDSLQERYDNFIPFYLKFGPTWINSLVDILDPMDKGFKLLTEE